jgi:hypothetical protein
MITQAACYAGHGILAARGEWITNEKRLLTRADLGEINAIVAGLRADVGELTRAVDAASRLLDDRLAAVGGCVDNALVVLTRVVVDLGEASGVELELFRFPRSHGGLSCPTLMPG